MIFKRYSFFINLPCSVLLKRKESFAMSLLKNFLQFAIGILNTGQGLNETIYVRSKMYMKHSICSFQTNFRLPDIVYLLKQGSIKI